MAISAGDITWDIGADLGNFEKGLASSKKQAEGLKSTLAKNSKAIGVGLTIAGAAGVAAFGGMISKAVDFSKSMAEVNTLGIKDLEGLSDSVKDVAGEFGLNLADAAKGAYQAISAGAKEAETPLILEKAAMAATAGVSDLTTAIELGTGVSNAFGIEFKDIDKIFDQAFVAVKGGVTTFEELSASVGKLSPIMAAAGLESKEMFAAIAALTKGGIKTSEAVTGLKGAITGILKPTTEAAKLAEELGIEFNAAALESQGLGGFMESLQEATGGNIEIMSKLFGSVEALNVVLALTGNQAASFNQLLKQMDSATGASKEAFDAFVAANPAFAFDQMKAKLGALAVDIGNILLPALIQITEKVIPIIMSMRNWAREHPRLTEAMVLLAAGISGLMLVLGPLLIILPGLTTAIGLFTASTVAAGTASTVASVGVFGLAASFAAAALPVIALTAAIAFATIGIRENIRAYKELKAAQEQNRQSEVRLQGAVEKSVQELEQMGVVVDRTALSAMNMDDQIAFLGKQFDKYDPTVEGAEKTTDRFAAATDGSTRALNTNVTATNASTGAQRTSTVETRTGTVAFGEITGRLHGAAGGYNSVAREARRAAAAIREANAAAAAGGGGGMAAGGVVAQGFASGGEIFKAKGTDTVPAMLTPGEFVVNKKSASLFHGLLEQINKTQTMSQIPSDFGGLTQPSGTNKTQKSIGTFAPVINFSINGTGLTAREIVKEIEAELFDSMTRNLKLAFG